MTWWRRFVRWRTHAAYWEQSAATNHLQNAWSHLCRVCWDCASARERKCLLPEDQEALDILHELAKESLDGQCQIIMKGPSMKTLINACLAACLVVAIIGAMLVHHTLTVNAALVENEVYMGEVVNTPPPNAAVEYAHTLLALSECDRLHFGEEHISISPAAWVYLEHELWRHPCRMYIALDPARYTMTEPINITNLSAGSTLDGNGAILDGRGIRRSERKVRQ